jgi:hypothetical protein
MTWISSLFCFWLFDICVFQYTNSIPLQLRRFCEIQNTLTLLCRLLHFAWNTENCDCARLEHFLEAEPFKAKRSIRSQQPIHHTMSAFDAFVTVHQYQLSAIPEELWQVTSLHYWRVRIGAYRLTPNLLHVQTLFMKLGEDYLDAGKGLTWPISLKGDV